MSSPRHLSAPSVVAALLLTLAPSGVRAAVHGGLPATGLAPDACALLTTEEVSTALEVKSLAGTHVVSTSTALCIWSDDPNHGIGNRRVTLALISQTAFDVGKSSIRATVEPVKGIGDDAYYEVSRSESPTLLVRKGGTAFTIRILNGLKFKPFTIEQDKAKEAALAQAAVKAL